MSKLLENLINLQGISGNEHEVRNFILKEIKKYSKSVSVDRMGNIIVRKKGKGPAVMLLAHMDEIGLIIKSIDDDGKIQISNVGGIDPVVLVGHRVEIESSKGEVNGIITTKDILNDRDSIKRVGIDSLFVFTGLNKKGLEKQGVRVGNYMAFSKSSNFCTLGSKEIVAGKSLDDRVGCYILLEVLRKLKTNHEVILVFTVQEEVGLYGAKASVFNLNPDYAIAVDVTGHDEDNQRMLLGRGPSLTIKDAEMLGNKCLNQGLEEVAKKLKVNIQREVSDAGTTDATSIFAAKGGVPSAVLGVPVANIHTTIGAAHIQDIEDVVTLLVTFLKNPPAKCWD
ncbi:MAG: M42 family metallopeptidase [Candidatus Pacearchaeota archaeon]